MTDKKLTIVIAGGSGFIGQSLIEHLRPTGCRIIVLTRQLLPNQGQVRYVQWDGRTLGPWAGELDGATALVNLAGRHVNCRYTLRNREQILQSRIDSVRVLGQALKQNAHRVPVWIQASTLAIYGDQADQMLTETAPAGEGFSPQIAQAWEAALEEAIPPQTRKVILRMSFVLGREGGALPTLARLAQWGLGGSISDGRQYYSWIHMNDVCKVITWAIERPTMQGVYNVTSPTPVRNKDFMRALRQAVQRPWSPPAPAWAVHVGCWLMGSEAELALRSRYGVPARLSVMAFPFQFSTLHDALVDLYPRMDGKTNESCETGHRPTLSSNLDANE